MLKHIFPVSVSVFLAIAIFAGCQPADYTDTIEFRLPDTEDETIASYTVELINPATQESFDSQEGLPGETLIFEFDRERVYVNSTVTAFAADGTVLDSTDAMILDLDWMSPGCTIKENYNYLTGANGTKISIEVDCYGTDFDIDFNNQDGEARFDFNLWDIWRFNWNR